MFLNDFLGLCECLQLFSTTLGLYLELQWPRHTGLVEALVHIRRRSTELLVAVLFLVLLRLRGLHEAVSLEASEVPMIAACTNQGLRGGVLPYPPPLLRPQRHLRALHASNIFVKDWHFV